MLLVTALVQLLHRKHRSREASLARSRPGLVGFSTVVVVAVSIPTPFKRRRHAQAQSVRRKGWAPRPSPMLWPHSPRTMHWPRACCVVARESRHASPAPSARPSWAEASNLHDPPTRMNPTRTSPRPIPTLLPAAHAPFASRVCAQEGVGSAPTSSRWTSS